MDEALSIGPVHISRLLVPSLQMKTVTDQSHPGLRGRLDRSPPALPLKADETHRREQTALLSQRF